jgi:hypothetical protein
MDKIGFNLTKINTLQFAIIEDAFNADIDKFNIETNLGYGVDSENSSILSSVKIQYEQNKVPFLIIEVSCEFNVFKNFWKEFESVKSITIPKGFMAHLAMITVGTTRGVLHEKTKSTRFNELVLPTINVEKMIKKDGEFNK